MMVRFQSGSIWPVAGSSTTVPTCSSPLTYVKSPTASSLPEGSVSRSFTWLLKLKAMPVKAPVFTSNAARPRDSVMAPSAPERTPVKLPPTNMVVPTCSKAWTWMLPSA